LTGCENVFPTWFDYLEGSFSFKEFQLKKMNACENQSPPAENVNETPTI